MKDWSWDRFGTLAVSVVTLLVVLFSAIRGVATKADLDALEGRLTTAINAVRTELNDVRAELKAEIRGIDTRIDRHLEMHATAAPGPPPD